MRYAYHPRRQLLRAGFSRGEVLSKLKKKHQARGLALHCSSHGPGQTTQAATHSAALASLLSRPRAFSHGATRLVPLLEPSSSSVPFSVSLEIVGHEESSVLDSSQPPAPPVDHEVLELMYVLSGSGYLSGCCECATDSRDGSPPPQWPLKSGVSVLSWANSTRLLAADGPGGQQEEGLAVLKFLIPVRMLDPSSASYGDAEKARSMLQGHGFSSLFSQGIYGVAVLDEGEASQLLSHAHKRTRRAFNAYPDKPSSHGAGAEAASGVRDSSPSSGRPADAATASTCSSAGMDSTPLTLPLVAESSPPGAASSASCSGSLPIISKGYGIDAATTITVSCNGEDPMTVPRSSKGAGGRMHTPDSPDDGQGGTVYRSPDTFQPVFDLDASLAGRPASESVLLRRAMEEWWAYQFPNQQNRLALAFDPALLGLSLSFGVEVFTPGHVTPLHTHQVGHEMFFVLAGKGDAWCDGHHIPVAAGDCIVFPPGTLHGLDNPSTQEKLYTLQMMVPDDSFIAFVQSGESLGSLDDEDLCTLTASRC